MLCSWSGNWDVLDFPGGNICSNLFHYKSWALWALWTHPELALGNLRLRLLRFCDIFSIAVLIVKSKDKKFLRRLLSFDIWNPYILGDTLIA